QILGNLLTKMKLDKEEARKWSTARAGISGLPLRLGLVVDAETGRRHGLEALVADRAAAGLAAAVGAALQALGGGLDLLELVLHLLPQRDVLLHLEGLGAAVARVLVEAGQLAGRLGGCLLLLTLEVVADPLEPGALLVDAPCGPARL